MISIMQVSSHGRAEKVAVIGLSPGGTSALRLASTEPDLVALSVAYYPGTASHWIRDKNELIRRWKVPAIAFAGEDDHGPGDNGCCLTDTIRAMAATAKQPGAPFDLILYPGARHDFVWPSSSAYNKDAAEDAWRRTLAALRRYLTEAMPAKVALGSWRRTRFHTPRPPGDRAPCRGQGRSPVPSRWKRLPRGSLIPTAKPMALTLPVR
jgi:dienelactone hydrolase